MSYQGSCHCGRIAFSVEGDLKEVVQCNCSICTKRGSLLWFVPRAALTLRTPEADLATYTFNKHRIKHRFCAVCGCAPFAEGSDPQGNAMAAINVRCLDGVDIDALPRKHFDGASS
jgi:hypothetical protein